MADDLTPWEHEMLEHFRVLGDEVADIGVTLRATYVSAHVRIGDGELVAITCEGERVRVGGRGYEVELPGDE
jgi:hypothetical protein